MPTPTTAGGRPPAPATPPPDDATTVLPLLRDALGELARTLPGPLHRLTMRAGDCALEVEFGPADPRPAGPAGAAPGAPAGPVTTPQEPPENSAGPAWPAGAVLVRAPLVGTFYVAPSPGAAPFVAVGDLVGPGRPVGIVEAMKLMNQVTAEIAGRVVAVLAADGASVEYDQPLVAVLPEA